MSVPSPAGNRRPRRCDSHSRSPNCCEPPRAPGAAARSAAHPLDPLAAAQRIVVARAARLVGGPERPAGVVQVDGAAAVTAGPVQAEVPADVVRLGVGGDVEDLRVGLADLVREVALAVLDGDGGTAVVQVDVERLGADTAAAADTHRVVVPGEWRALGKDADVQGVQDDGVLAGALDGERDPLLAGGDRPVGGGPALRVLLVRRRADLLGVAVDEEVLAARVLVDIGADGDGEGDGRGGPVRALCAVALRGAGPGVCRSGRPGGGGG